MPDGARLIGAPVHDDGIEVKNEAVLTVSGCTIEGNGDNGIKLDKHVVATISGSTIRVNGLNGDDKKGYGVFRKCDGQGGTPVDATLTGNVLSGNLGKGVAGSSDQQLGNYDQIIDVSVQQAGYSGACVTGDRLSAPEVPKPRGT